MALYDVALLAQDFDFRQRVTACYVTENPADDNPSQWAADYQWHMASTPSFGDKYAYALATGIENPGRQESVISDADILSAVQALLASLNPS